MAPVQEPKGSLVIVGMDVAFYQGLELSFLYGALTCSSAIGLVLHTRDYNLASFGARGRG